ncbi:MAG: Maf family protein [Limisphaerales bacterium]
MSTDVLFRACTDATIAEYLSEVNTLDKAGAYAIQQHGEWLVSEISGSFSNVVGLPLERLESELKLWEAR